MNIGEETHNDTTKTRWGLTYCRQSRDDGTNMELRKGHHRERKRNIYNNEKEEKEKKKLNICKRRTNTNLILTLHKI